MADLVRAEIASILSAVVNIGRVQPFERYCDRNKELLDHYVDNNQLRGWFVRRVSVLEQSPTMGDRTLETVRWQIRGYMALDDEAETELAFDDLLDLIRQAFRDKHDLNGVVMTTISDSQAGLAIEDTGPVLFGGVLCHSARASLITKRYF